MRKICQTILALILMSVSMHVMSQEYRIPLYSGSIPNSKPGNGNERIEKQEITVISNVQVPEIAVYLPTKRFATGQAVVRPDIMVLMYPVISFADGITHLGSREALLGKNPVGDLQNLYSNELQVKDDTPPAFFVHANNDDAVPVENTLLMYKALREKNIPAELHILSEGKHGFGLAVNNQHIASWSGNLKLWLNWLLNSYQKTTEKQ